MAILENIMTREVVTVSAEATLREAVELLRARNVRGAPVVQGSEVVGVVSVSDILDMEVQAPTPAADDPGPPSWRDIEAEAPTSFYGIDIEDETEVAEWFATDVHPDWDVLEGYLVRDVMTRNLFALPPDTPLDEAGRYMSARGIHRVLVTDGKQLLGIASASDFVRAVGEGRV